ncbi:hypothetical protein TRFO_11919 [Tritrichomonas foetus]|uniref:DUF3447 domain-containing protein n=1 Tax=Tritrichomonas foetus TaxID=1144522 RepID=A0A1J4J178_9EUKA|nr:hypothetical protein TRFO_11919 [Tritrichomonas foetus]|eukprot:OHS93296.1 hypothetical protein TRFO_11919 [Tritrichomonas foetus]
MMNTLIGYDEFTQKITKLRNLQRMVISIMSCEEKQLLDQIGRLFDYFRTISISSDFEIFEGFLYLLVSLSIDFIISQKNQLSIYLAILKELISKHSMTELFHQSTLFQIFRANKHFILFLLENRAMDISLIKNILSTRKSKHNFFLFFAREIKEAYPELYKKRRKQYIEKYGIGTWKEERNKQKLTKYEIRREIHSQEEIAKIISVDDLDSFLHYISRTDNFSLNYIIKPSLYENNRDIKNQKKGISLLEYSMVSGSIKIFRFLWLKKAEYFNSSHKYSIIGGNYEIIHIIEEESNYTFDRNLMHIAIQYYRNDVYAYILNSLLKTLPTVSQILDFLSSNPINNYEIISELLIKQDPQGIDINQEKMILELKDMIIKYGLNAQRLFVSFFYSFILQQPNIDVNTKETICCFCSRLSSILTWHFSPIFIIPHCIMLATMVIMRLLNCF